MELSYQQCGTFIARTLCMTRLWHANYPTSILYLKEELPPGIFGNEKIFLFTKEKEVQEVIGSLVARRVFEDREIEFLFGLEDSQIARMVRVLTFTQKELYNELNTLRVKLGVYY